MEIEIETIFYENKNVVSDGRMRIYGTGSEIVTYRFTTNADVCIMDDNVSGSQNPVEPIRERIYDLPLTNEIPEFEEGYERSVSIRMLPDASGGGE